jgi:hypothetical protein
MLNGLISGIISSLFTHPIDTIKVHRQMVTPLIPELMRIGPKLFYRGYSKSFAKICISSCLFFPLFDFFHFHIKNTFLASGCTAILATTIMHPVDYLKTRHIYGLPLYQSNLMRSYYKGLSLNLMRIVPHFIIFMSIIEILKKQSYNTGTPLDSTTP